MNCSCFLFSILASCNNKTENNLFFLFEGQGNAKEITSTNQHKSGCERSFKA